MRLHIQNPPDTIPASAPSFAITQQQWDEALARSPDMAGLVMTMAHDDPGFIAGVGDADVLLTWTKEVRQRLPKGALPGVAPRLRIISCTSAGLDRLMPFDWLPGNVALLNNSGAHGAKAGEFGIMALLMLANHMPVFAADQHMRRWAPRFGSVLAGRTVGIVGLGAIGSAVAMRAQQFGMTVLGVRNDVAPHAHAHEVHPVSALEAVLPRCEFLVLACPLTDRTRNLLSRDRLDLLPHGAKLVNMARGPVWDQDALCDMLDAGRLGPCLTDVATPEPLPEDHRMWRTPGLTITPHMSSDDPETYNERTLDILFANLRADRAGQPMPNRVEPARGY